MPRWPSLHLRLPPRTPGCTGSRHAPLRKPHGDTRVGALERGYRVAAGPRRLPCRGRRFVESRSLSLTGPCRDVRCIAASFLKCRGWPSRQAPLTGALSLPGKILLPGPWLAFPASSSCRGLGWPSRQAPLAGALVGLPGKLLLPGPWFEYFVLEWSSREPQRVLAVTRQALPRGAATARARVRGNRVPLL